MFTPWTKRACSVEISPIVQPKAKQQKKTGAMNTKNKSYEPKYATKNRPAIKTVSLQVAVTRPDLQNTIGKLSTWQKAGDGNSTSLSPFSHSRKAFQNRPTSGQRSSRRFERVADFLMVAKDDALLFTERAFQFSPSAGQPIPIIHRTASERRPDFNQVSRAPTAIFRNDQPCAAIRPTAAQRRRQRRKRPIARKSTVPGRGWGR